jgi:hypothetical protein
MKFIDILELIDIFRFDQHLRRYEKQAIENICRRMLDRQVRQTETERSTLAQRV